MADIVTAVSQVAIVTEVKAGSGDHRALTGRTAADSHPVAAITGLQGALDSKVDKVTGKQLSTEDYSTGEKQKLANIAAGAEANVNSDWNATTGDAAILNKPDLPNLYEPKNSNIQGHISSTSNPHGVTAAQAGAVPTASVGAANGVAPLGADSKIASAYLPSYVDDVVEVADFAALPVTGETGKIYVALDTGKIYRWGGSAYAEISPSPGSTDSVTEGATNLYFTAARALAAAPAETGATLSAIVVAATAETTPAAADTLPLSGSAASNALKKLSFSNLSAALSNPAATITSNANGTVNTIAEIGKTYTIAYNANGTINTISDGTTTRTCSYSGGNLAGIA